MLAGQGWPLRLLLIQYSEENQVEEVTEVMDEITGAMSAPDGSMSRISQKGTGWGKSTAIQMLSDHACLNNIGHAERSVLVCAPSSNQAELNNTLGRYYASSGRHYQALDIQRDYADREKIWWTPENISRIHNTLLGIDADTAAEDRVTAVNELRAPVGLSVRDAQILMQLRNRLQQKDRSHNEEVALSKLDAVTDLMNQSMVLMDEWDFTLMPPRVEDLRGLANDINKALSPLRSANIPDIAPFDIVGSHAQMVLGCQKKLLMSATLPSEYGAALVTGKVSPAEISAACHKDLLTTEQRFWHWLNNAHLVYVDDSSRAGAGKRIMSEVMDTIGNRQGNARL